MMTWPGRQVPEPEMLGIIRQTALAATISEASRLVPFLQPGSEESLTFALDKVAEFLRAMRAGGNLWSSLSDVVCDLRLSNVFWFSFAHAVLASRIALPGQSGTLIAKINEQTGIYVLGCMVAANTAVLANYMSNSGQEFNEWTEKPGLYMVSDLQFGRDVLSGFATATPRSNQKSHIEEDLEELRQGATEGDASPKTS